MSRQNRETNILFYNSVISTYINLKIDITSCIVNLKKWFIYTSYVYDKFACVFNGNFLEIFFFFMLINRIWLIWFKNWCDKIIYIFWCLFYLIFN